MSINDKINFYGIKDELAQLKKEMNKKIPSELEKKYIWICRNLSVYRNCFISDTTLNRINLDVIKRILKVDEVYVRQGEDIDAGMSYGIAGYILSI